MSESLDLCFMPPLILLIVNAHNQKGSSLTREEVESIRDAGVCIALPAGSSRSMAEKRGYEDFSAENVWEDYLAYLDNENNE
ncbi:hypothetical protein [Enterobacter sp. Bisph1]|uniref:hypothetical protein n=1 Tax=Enterobacter sp. Bisph1 TaxID=1274399 RepID=UPI00057BEFBC|nr:hypothetical protein [Enterobacter sp. Bisph1]